MADTKPARWTEYVQISDLVPDGRNPKSHDLRAIQSSMATLGFIDAPIIDERTGKLIGGHGRVETLLDAHLAGLAPPEGVQVDADGQWLTPVQRGWASADDEEAAAALIALNRLTEKGGWRDEPLADLLGALPTELLNVTGYSSDDLAGLLASVAPVEAPDGFPSFDPDSLATDYGCPKCGYEWSGSPHPNGVAVDDEV